jgi:hypothetical protein
MTGKVFYYYDVNGVRANLYSDGETELVVNGQSVFLTPAELANLKIVMSYL